jgi:dTDP-glucose 4,6-dehydratase
LKTILVTGGKGFIGSHVIMNLLKNEKARIVIADAETYAARKPLYLFKSDNVIEEKVDIRDHLAVHRLYSKYKPHTTIHMAAESHVCRSITGPKDFATTNMLGTFHVLEEHRSNKGKRFVHVSTDEVFGEIKEGLFTELSPLKPRSPYASTKAASDLLVKSYFHTYGMDAVTVNMSNNFGPNQHAEKLVPRTIINIISGKQVVVHGKGNHVRDWLYVEDAAEGIRAAMNHGKPGEGYCLGGHKELTNLAMIREIYQAVKILQPTIGKLNLKFTNDRPTDDFRYALGITKAYEHLDWIPGVTRHGEPAFHDNLIKTCEWYIHAMLHGGDVALHGRDA